MNEALEAEGAKEGAVVPPESHVAAIVDGEESLYDGDEELEEKVRRAINDR